MSEIDAKTATVLKAVWANQKKSNVVLKKVFSFAPIDAEQLVRKLDKNSLASPVIDAVVHRVYGHGGYAENSCAN